MPTSIERFWRDFLATRPTGVDAEAPYVAEHFGDNPRLADELGALILRGIKTATCSSLWEWEAEDAPIPHVGMLSIVLDGTGDPICVIETTEVTIRAFNQVDAQFAYDEGEDNRSLDAWRREHWRYFGRVLPKIGRAPTPDMPLVCERFRVRYPQSGQERTVRCSVYIATSLDGFIARADGSLDWLPQPDDAAASSEDYGYGAFMDAIDHLVMGRGTFDFVRNVTPWPYAKPVIVLSHTRMEIPPQLAENVEWMSGSPHSIVQTLATRGARHLYVDGGKTIQQFLAADLIDELIITRIPILIGDGLPLFGPLPQDVAWRHVETHAYASGLVQSRYTRTSAMA